MLLPGIFDDDPYEDPPYVAPPDESDELEELEAAGARADEDDVPVLAHALRVATRRKGISLRIM
jgi:hypothetical protein